MLLRRIACRCGLHLLLSVRIVSSINNDKRIGKWKELYTHGIAVIPVNAYAFVFVAPYRLVYCITAGVGLLHEVGYTQHPHAVL